MSLQGSYGRNVLIVYHCSLRLGRFVQQASAFDQLHHERPFFQPVNLGDIRVVQRGEHFGFALISCDALGIVGETLRQDLEWLHHGRAWCHARDKTSPMPPAPSLAVMR